VVAVREVGAGRSLSVMTDGSWYWGFVAAGDGQGGRAHQRFWNGALRWLVRDPSLAPLQIQPDRPAVEPGEPVGFSVAVRGPDYGPAPGASVEGSLVAEDGRVIGRASARAGSDGAARLEFAAPPPGAYRLQASAEVAGAPAERGAAAVAVRSSGAEDSDAAPRPELLRQVADATGGTFTRLPQVGLPEIRLREPEVVEVGRKKDEPLWDRWWYLAFLAAALSGEWVLRRRLGHW
jgi:hypothetical protein